MTRLQGIHVEFVKLAFYLYFILSVFASVSTLLCVSLDVYLSARRCISTRWRLSGG